MISLCFAGNRVSQIKLNSSNLAADGNEYLTTPWIYPWPIEVHEVSPFLNLTEYSQKDLEGLALLMRLQARRFLFNQTVPGYGWIAFYGHNTTMAQLYEQQHGSMYLCQPRLSNIPAFVSHLSCWNYTYYGSAAYETKLRNTFSYWYNYQQPAVSIMIAIAFFVTLTGVTGKSL